jgi:hypothetical protein
LDYWTFVEKGTADEDWKMMKSSFGYHGQQPCFLCDANRVVSMDEDARSEFTP